MGRILTAKDSFSRESLRVRIQVERSIFQIFHRTGNKIVRSV